MEDSETYYCYYTPDDLAACLLTLIPEDNVRNAIDINCGAGSLLKAAQGKYPHAQLTGIDIKNNSFYRTLKNCTFYCKDAFEYTKGCKKKYDLVLSNPPFGRSIKEDTEAELKVEDVAVKGLQRRRLECLMFNANLALMHDDSWLLIILPATFVCGESFKKVRKEICQKYHVSYIVSLPDDTFGGHKIRTYALILYGSQRNENTQLLKAHKRRGIWTISKVKIRSEKSIKDGKWWIFKRKRNADNTLTIFRGNVSSSDFVKNGIAVFHCSKKGNDIWRPSYRYVSKLTDRQMTKKAKIGDVIINRIGHYAGYWWINTVNERAVTDCLFVLQGLDNPLQLLEKCSTDGRLNIDIHGLATQYVTSDDILDLIYRTMEIM